MKKEYLQPAICVLKISTVSVLAVSGNFEEAETIDTGLHDDPISGDDAWSKAFGGVAWDDEQ